MSESKIADKDMGEQIDKIESTRERLCILDSAEDEDSKKSYSLADISNALCVSGCFNSFLYYSISRGDTE